jgi:hypothetical protein
MAGSRGRQLLADMVKVTRRAGKVVYAAWIFGIFGTTATFYSIDKPNHPDT